MGDLPYAIENNVNPLSPDPTAIRSLMMKPRGGVLTEQLLSRILRKDEQ